MATFSQLVDKVTILTKDYNIDTVAILRDGEKDYIQKCWCTEKLHEIDTQEQNEGELTALYDLPEDWVKSFRLEWNHIPLETLSQKEPRLLYNASQQLISGLPVGYWIEGQQIRLIPKPSQHGILRLWYCYQPVGESLESPVIPDIEHVNLVHYAVATILEMNEREDRAAYYWEKYNRAWQTAKGKYKNQRNRQTIILDVNSGTMDPLSIENRAPLVTED